MRLCPINLILGILVSINGCVYSQGIEGMVETGRSKIAEQQERLQRRTQQRRLADGVDAQTRAKAKAERRKQRTALLEQPENLPLANEALVKSLALSRQQACDSEKLVLRCPVRTQILVEHAFYGRLLPSQELCPPSERPVGKEKKKKKPKERPGVATWEELYEDLSCDVSNAKEKITSKCKNSRKCKISVSPQYFGQDPCPTTSKYLQIAYRCRPNQFNTETYCENSEMRLHCPKKAKLALYSAIYGAVAGNRVCASSRKTVASYEVAQFCQGKSACNISVSSDLFKDPCPYQVQKYVTVNFACVKEEIFSAEATNGQTAQTSTASLNHSDLAAATTSLPSVTLNSILLDTPRNQSITPNNAERLDSAEAKQTEASDQSEDKARKLQTNFRPVDVDGDDNDDDDARFMDMYTPSDVKPTVAKGFTSSPTASLSTFVPSILAKDSEQSHELEDESLTGTQPKKSMTQTNPMNDHGRPVSKSYIPAVVPYDSEMIFSPDMPKATSPMPDYQRRTPAPTFLPSHVPNLIGTTVQNLLAIIEYIEANQEKFLLCLSVSVTVGLCAVLLTCCLQCCCCNNTRSDNEGRSRCNGKATSQLSTANSDYAAHIAVYEDTRMDRNNGLALVGRQDGAFTRFNSHLTPPSQLHAYNGSPTSFYA